MENIFYAHFWKEGHRSMDDVTVQVKDVTDVRDPTCREAFWIGNSHIPLGLNGLENEWKFNCTIFLSIGKEL